MKWMKLNHDCGAFAFLGCYVMCVGSWLPVLWNNHLQRSNSLQNLARVMSVPSDILRFFCC